MSSEVQLPIHISSPSVGADEWEATKEVFESGWVTQGPKVQAFEKEFAKIHGCQFAVATTSCTTGMHLALEAMGIGPGDEVIVPSFTWVATANVVKYCGATPVFADVDPQTYNLCLKSVASKVSNKTKAILPVHLFGLCADVEALRQSYPDLLVLEDAACATGSSLAGKMAGSLGHAGVFSLHPRKVVTTGEGGMITTNDSDLYEKMVQLRNHGASVSEEARHTSATSYLLPDFKVLGFNYRLTDIQGAVGLAQLPKLPHIVEQRNQVARYYSENLADVEWLKTPVVPEGAVHTWQSYVCLVDKEKAPFGRNEVLKQLFEKQIHCRPGTHAVHLLEYYQQEGLSLPGAEICDSLSLSLPIHAKLRQQEYDYIIETLKSLSRSRGE